MSGASDLPFCFHDTKHLKCLDCAQTLCHKCRSKHQADHTLIDLHDVALQHRNDIWKMVETYDRDIRALEHNMKAIEKYHDYVIGLRDKTLKDLDENKKLLNGLLPDRFDILKSIARKESNMELTPLCINYDDIKRINESLEELRRLLQYSDENLALNEELLTNLRAEYKMHLQRRPVESSPSIPQREMQMYYFAVPESRLQDRLPEALYGAELRITTERTGLIVKRLSENLNSSSPLNQQNTPSSYQRNNFVAKCILFPLLILLIALVLKNAPLDFLDRTGIQNENIDDVGVEKPDDVIIERQDVKPTEPPSKQENVVYRNIPNYCFKLFQVGNEVWCNQFEAHVNTIFIYNLNNRGTTKVIDITGYIDEHKVFCDANGIVVTGSQIIVCNAFCSFTRNAGHIHPFGLVTVNRNGEIQGDAIDTGFFGGIDFYDDKLYALRDDDDNADFTSIRVYHSVDNTWTTDYDIITKERQAKTYSYIAVTELGIYRVIDSSIYRYKYDKPTGRYLSDNPDIFHELTVGTGTVSLASPKLGLSHSRKHLIVVDKMRVFKCSVIGGGTGTWDELDFDANLLSSLMYAYEDSHSHLWLARRKGLELILQ